MLVWSVSLITSDNIGNRVALYRGVAKPIQFQWGQPLLWHAGINKLPSPRSAFKLLFFNFRLKKATLSLEKLKVDSLSGPGLITALAPSWSSGEHIGQLYVYRCSQLLPFVSTGQLSQRFAGRNTRTSSTKLCRYTFINSAISYQLLFSSSKPLARPTLTTLFIQYICKRRMLADTIRKIWFAYSGPLNSQEKNVIKKNLKDIKIRILLSLILIIEIKWIELFCIWLFDFYGVFLDIF